MRKLKDLNPLHSLKIAPMSENEQVHHYAFQSRMPSQTRGNPPYFLVNVQPSPFTGDQSSAKTEMQFTELWMDHYEDMKKKASTPGPLDKDRKGVVWRGYCKHEGCHFSCKVIRIADKYCKEKTYLLGLYVQGNHNHHEAVKGIASTLNTAKAVASTHSPAISSVRRYSNNQEDDLTMEMISNLYTAVIRRASISMFK